MAIASVKASGSDGSGAANTMDGKLNTRWSAFGKGQWIQYDLAATKRWAGSISPGIWEIGADTVPRHCSGSEQRSQWG
jgi:hypothetical protein